MAVGSLCLHQFEALERTLAFVHAHQHEGGEREREEQGQAVGVVEPGHQHNEQQQREAQSSSGRQDIQAPPQQLQRQWVGPLALAGPLFDALGHTPTQRG